MRPWFGWAAARAAWRDRSAPPAHGRRTVIYYDGECVMCHGVVRLLLRVGVPSDFHFASQQGEAWAALLTANPKLAQVDSIVVARDTADTGSAWVRIRAEAVLWLLAQLRAPFPVAALLFVVPLPVLDLGYRLVARFRKRILGELPPGACPIPPTAFRDRFLD